MGGRLMKEQLTEISQKAQAETIDLWPEIYGELKETKTVKHPKLNYQLARLAAVFSLFFVGALVVYAVSQIYVDSGLEGERAERLVTQVNQSITHDDMTIRLDWAYADVNRISFGFSVLDSEDNVYVPPVDELYYFASMEIEQHNEDGTFSLLGDPEILEYYLLYEEDIEQQVYTQVFYLDKLPETQLEIALKLEFPQAANQAFEFSFPISVYPALFSSQSLIMDSEETPMVLDEFSITPTLTSAHICFDLPVEFQRDENIVTNSVWFGTGVQIYFDGINVAELYPNISGYFGGLDLVVDKACTTLILAIPLDTLPSNVRIGMQEMREIHGGYYTLGEAELLQRIYLEHGIEVSISRIYFTHQRDIDYSRAFYISWPEEFRKLSVFERISIQDMVMDDFFATNPDAFRITGPWEIEFELQDPLN
jgi:hypothetical protein